MKTDRESEKPDELRTLVQLQSEAERLAAELREDFSKEQNLVERVDRAVAQFRQSHAYK